jgi:hypothetical protein
VRVGDRYVRGGVRWEITAVEPTRVRYVRRSETTHPMEGCVGSAAFEEIVRDAEYFPARRGE